MKRPIERLRIFSNKRIGGAVAGQVRAARNIGRQFIMIIGVISDTHGFVHRAIFEAFRNVDAIIHAGDIGDESVLRQLEALAPVYAVRGNVDGGGLYKLDKILYKTFGGIRITTTHNAGDLIRPAWDMEKRILIRPTDILISGHYHAYWCAPLRTSAGNVLWLSPGAAGNSGHHRQRMALRLTLPDEEKRTGDVVNDIKLETISFGARGED